MSTGIQLLITGLGTIIFAIILPIFVSMTVNSKDYKYYKTTYFAILNCTYVMVRNSYNQQTYHKPDEPNPYTNDEIIFFLNGSEVDSIKLLSRPNENHYIHSKGGTDLYARYWFKKILKVRDKYNHQLWVSTRQEEIREREYITRTYSLQKQEFKFLRG
jgi:hypothetical protein